MTLLRRKPFAARLALAAMILNALWPLLASAKPNIPSLPSEVCSASGLKHSGERLPDGTRGTTFQLSHCSLCPFNAERGPAIWGAAPALVCPMFDCGQVRESFAERQLQPAFDPSAPPRAPPPFS